jgi:hypothetical protein
MFFFSLFYYSPSKTYIDDKADAVDQEVKLSLTTLPIVVKGSASAAQNSHAKTRQHSILHAWGYALLFSFAVFTKIQFGKRLTVNYWLVPLVTVEWLLGYVMIAGLILSLTNINPLLTSLFQQIKIG